MLINDARFSGCCDWGTGRIGRTALPEIVVVGHTRITTNGGEWVNLSALDFDGNILWQVNMGLDSFGHKKRPMHIRFDSQGAMYVAWNSPYYIANNGENDPDSEAKYLLGYSSGSAPASTVGGVDKYDRNGNLIWSTELPAQESTISGSLWNHYGNCVDVDPTDGSIWTSTFRDTNGDYIHHLDADDGSLILSFGATEFIASDATIPISTSALAVVNWLRLTENGNIWFSMTGSSTGEPRGPYKCDPSGAILERYSVSFGPTSTDQIIRVRSILVMGEDDIVVGGGAGDHTTNQDTPPNEDIVQRWDVAADTKTWGRSPRSHALTWASVGGIYTPANYGAHWVDGNSARFVYGTELINRDSSGHDYTVFHLDSTGAAQFASTHSDVSSPYTDPRDHIRAPAAIACMTDHTFAAGARAAFDATRGVQSSQVVSLNPSTGRVVWWNDLDNADSTSGHTYCIAAYQA